MKPSSRFATLAVLLSALTVSSGPLSGQATPVPNAPPAPSPSGVKAEEETIVLSPFEVTSDEESNSYAAATTLAGNRLNTDLRDIGAAVSVVTEQFLRDVGATSNESLLQYTTNTEVGNIYGTMANAGSGTQLEETRTFVAPNTNTRVRGLSSADNTIDFFLTDIPWDSYNTDRVDFQRGPNSILFGLGSPAGIINAGTKQAGFRNRGRLELRYSRFGSVRTSLDYNHVLMPKQLAVRINLLNNDEKFQQKPAFQLDRRAHGTVRFEPEFLNQGSAHTTLRVNYETGRIRSNRPRTIPPGDALTPWFYTGTAAGFDPTTGAPRTYNNLNRIGFDAWGLQDQQIATTGVSNRGQFVSAYVGGAVNPYYQPWLGGQFAAGYFGNPMAVFDNDGSTARYFAAEPSAVRGVNTLGVIDGSIGGIPSTRMSSPTIYRDWARKTGQPGALFGLTRNLVVTDPTVFDFYNNLIDGPNKEEWQNFRKLNLNLAQTFFHGNVGIEVAHDRQHYDNGQLVFMTDKGQAIYADVIERFADGTINPNFGRPFIADSIGNNRVTDNEREASRVTAFVSHDFDKGDNNSFLRRVLGRQILTGFANTETKETDTRGFLRYGTEIAYKNFVTNPTTFSTLDSSTRAIYPVIYLGPSLANRTTAAGANIPRPKTFNVAKTGTIRVFDSTWNAPASVSPAAAWTNLDFPVGNTRRISTQSENPANYRGWVDLPFTVLDSEEGLRDALTTNATLSKLTVSSQAAVWNGYFWNRALVGMYGWRHDISKAWTFSGVRNRTHGQVNLSQEEIVDVAPTTPPTSNKYRLPDAFRDRIDEQSTSWSIVGHLSQLFPRALDRLPLNVSLFYNQSENFAASAGRVGPLNENLGPPLGNTRDVGVALSTKDGKYSLKFNRYRSNSQNASSSGFNIFYLRQLFTDYHPWKNVFKHRIDGTLFDLTGTQGNDPNRWAWQPRVGQTAQQALDDEAASITAWETMISQIPPDFFTAYNIRVNEIRQYNDAITPAGLTVTEDNVSKGYEIELGAQPLKSIRLTFNASRAQAERSNVGQPSILNLVQIINTALNNTPAGIMRNSSSGTAATALTAWNNNFYAPYISIKTQEGGAVPELREWRANFVANYDFLEGRLKGLSVGGGLRWQGRAVIGYEPRYVDGAGAPAANHVVARAALLQLDRPYYAPAEYDVDLWVGYKWRLSEKLGFRTQFNLRNVANKDRLIPVTVQPDGTPAGYRIAPAQLWSLTNTLEF